jgi:Domain of unknown function (DUF4126)
MNLLTTIAMAMGSSWVSGINLYASVATLGLLGRFAGLRLPGELTILTSWWIIAIAVILYIIEFVADKVPWIDSIWDVVHTFIRVPAGAILAAAAFGDFNKSVQVIAFLLGGGLALSSHGTKAATRAVLNVSPEPVSNIVASIVEDIIAVASILLAAFFPLLLFVVVGIGVTVSLLVLPRTYRYFRSGLRKLRRRRAPVHSTYQAAQN